VRTGAVPSVHRIHRTDVSCFAPRPQTGSCSFSVQNHIGATFRAAA
jgi:hypothetical protein